MKEFLIEGRNVECLIKPKSYLEEGSRNSGRFAYFGDFFSRMGLSKFSRDLTVAPNPGIGKNYRNKFHCFAASFNPKCYF